MASLVQISPQKPGTHLFPPPICGTYTTHLFSSWLGHPNNIWWAVHAIKLLLMQSPPLPVTSSLLWPNVFLSSRTSLMVTDQVSQPHKTKGKIILLRTLIFHVWVPVTTAWRVLRLRIEERPPIRREAANKLNKQSRTAHEGWSSSFGVGRGADNPSL